MAKKILSVLLAVLLTASTFAVFSADIKEVQAADYAASLKNKGFPESYIKPLTELHKKYPNWIFKPIKTNLNFQTAVNGERKSHSNQLIEKLSGTNEAMYCSCANCKKNGKYVIQEGHNWVSASEAAVKYYLDPRNFLNEKGIFQFESTSYDGTQTKSGVESILNGTWMHNSYITYKNTYGNQKQYDSKTKYSDAIMQAAKNSGMSAYYLASKIRQENGGAKATATAVGGTTSPFQGIYNYFNIGAYTGARDGLAWAAGYLKLNKKTTLYSSYNSKTNKPGGTKTSLKAGQYLTYKGSYGNYYHVRLYTENGNNSYSEGKSGFLLKSACRTTYTGTGASGWGRPWTNPYKAIFYGSKYISQNYQTQNTGYLQKFNVSPEANTLYTHEYMANVAAAAAESATTYSAYKNAGILGVTKTFLIPVFNNMPSSTKVTLNAPSTATTMPAATPTNNLPCLSGLKATGSTTQSVDLTWNKISGVTGYMVDIYKNGKYVRYASTSGNKITVKKLSNATAYKFRVKAYKKSNGTTYYGKYWKGIEYATKPSKVSNFRATGSNNSAVYLAWNKNTKASGYKLFQYDTSKKKYVMIKDIKGSKNTTFKVAKLKNNTSYKFKIQAYSNIAGKTYYSDYSSIVTRATKKNMVTPKSAVSNSAKRITVKWNKAPYACSGYEVMWSTNSNFKNNFLSVYVNGQNKLSTTLKTSQSKKNYYVRVRAYKTVNGKKQYCSWSSTLKVKVK